LTGESKPRVVCDCAGSRLPAPPIPGRRHWEEFKAASDIDKYSKPAGAGAGDAGGSSGGP